MSELGCLGTVFVLMVVMLGSVSCVQTIDYDSVNKIYLKDLASRIGNGTVDQLEQYYLKYLLHSPSNSNISECFDVSSDNQHTVIKEKCLLKKCLTPEDVIRLSGIKENNNEGISTLATILLHLRDNDLCKTVEQHEETTSNREHTKPTTFEVWGYGILCTTVISVCSLGGLIALPFVHKTVYNQILTYMVGLAVGTLVGSSLLFLIPEALELTEQDLDEHSYIWKCLVAMSGVYVFFIIERILKMITVSREKSEQDKAKHHEMTSATFVTFHGAEPEFKYKNTETLPHMSPCGDDVSKDSRSSDNDESMHRLMEKERPNENGHVSSVSHGHSHVAPVAWMIIFGDGLHNFIDGVSIGAAFTESILAGVSVSVAILCEEIPHELGDFAVLLNAGMKIKKAVCYNFISACMCYIGLVVGIFLGENTSAHVWVFAFAGGMFLYISLVDMMPEMNATAESEEKKHSIGPKQIFLLQNLGLLSGFGVMLIMAVYGGNLEAAIKGEH
ncbi:hypothetical protein ACF0H5_015383 [Mactra antiquata]